MTCRAALLLPLSRIAGDSCSPWALRMMNGVLDLDKGAFNRLWRERGIDTLGDCSTVTAPEMQPCRSNKHFPMTERATGATLTIDYLTHMHDLTITSLYVTCQNDDDGIEVHYVNMDIMGSMAVGVSVEVLGLVPMEYSCKPGESCMMGPSMENVTAHLSGRLECVSAHQFKVGFNPKDGIAFSKPLTAQIDANLGISYDFTSVATSFAQEFADGTVIDCDKHEVTRLFCQSSCAAKFASTTTTTLVEGLQCNRATPDTCAPVTWRRAWVAKSCPAGKECVNGVCYCARGSCNVNGDCMSCDVNTSFTCGFGFFDAGCDAETSGSSHCDGSRCVCEPGSCVQESGKCAPFCNRDTGRMCWLTGCQTVHGVSHSSCIDSKCVCEQDYCAKDGVCVPRDQVYGSMFATTSTATAAPLALWPGYLASALPLLGVGAALLGRRRRAAATRAEGDYVSLAA